MSNYWGVLREDQWTLGDLRWHWGSAYVIFHSLRCWKAIRRDDTSGDMTRTLKANEPAELAALIRADYAACPVPR
jgi:hypothetical protein